MPQPYAHMSSHGHFIKRLLDQTELCSSTTTVVHPQAIISVSTSLYRPIWPCWRITLTPTASSFYQMKAMFAGLIFSMEVFMISFSRANHSGEAFWVIYMYSQRHWGWMHRPIPRTATSNLGDAKERHVPVDSATKSQSRRIGSFNRAMWLCTSSNWNSLGKAG